MASFDFRQQQERSRRTSLILVGVFIAMVVLIGLVLGTLASVAFATMDEGAPPGDLGLELDRMLGMSLVAMAAIFAIAWFKLWSFGGDGAKVAAALGAEEVPEDTQNPYKKRYLNVLDEMSIAAGLPRPRAFVIKHEKGINAFAAGGSPDRAAIGVTHGALSMLTRDELAGVVGHEMAHISNHDTRLNMRLMAMVFSLVVVYTLGRGLLRSAALSRRSRNSRGMAPILAFGLAMLMLGMLGVFFGRVLQSAVSRRREFLADATGVQFTRDPQGLANALKKIGAASAGSRVGNEHAEEARHMFFAGATSSLTGLFSTHPPLHARIRALDPRFDPATDPILASSDKELLRRSHAEIAGPWGGMPNS